MNKKILTLFDIIRITYSSKFAMKKAKEYWSNTTLTHGSMDESQFDFYFTELFKLLSPNKRDVILDYGGGNGEIAFRFKKGFNITHCDLNPNMVQNAKYKYNLDSYLCEQLSSKKYNKIIFHNAIFYIHPCLLKKFIQSINNILHDNGKLYITDTPDFDKRNKLYSSKIKLLFTKYFPVYQPSLAGFFVKTSQLQSIANELGFSIIKINSWTDYRSHWVLTKENIANFVKHCTS